MATGSATTVTATVSIRSGKAERKAGEGRPVEFWEFLFPTVKRLHIPKLRALALFSGLLLASGGKGKERS
jgi:hypothetical protein